MIYPYFSRDQAVLSGFLVLSDPGLPHQYPLLCSLIVSITNKYISTCLHICVRSEYLKAFKEKSGFKKEYLKVLKILVFSVQFVTKSGCRGSGTPGGIVTHPWGLSRVCDHHDLYQLCYIVLHGNTFSS